MKSGVGVGKVPVLEGAASGGDRNFHRFSYRLRGNCVCNPSYGCKTLRVRTASSCCCCYPLDITELQRVLGQAGMSWITVHVGLLRAG